LYIDDDFCQGISQSLAANMELLPPPDFFDSLDFNILSAEIFHSQHEYDDTLTGEENFNQIEAGQQISKNDEGVFIEDAAQQDDEEKRKVPNCDEHDEPKVDEQTNE
jgi:hypothetical protein